MLQKCQLWADPQLKLSRPLREEFELVSELFRESHWWQYVLKCRCCGQVYLMEFFETIDWEKGEDPQWTTWVPLRNADDATRFCGTPVAALRLSRPYLRIDHPKSEPTVVEWIT